MTHRSVHAASHTARTAARVAPAGAASRCRRRRDSGCEAAGNETGRDALLFLTLLIFFVDKRFAKSGSHRIASQVASPPPPVPSPHVSVSHSLRRDECFFAFALCSTDSASFVRPSRRIACARLASFFFSCLSMPRAIFTILSFISCISSVTLFDACLFSNADRGSRSRRAFRPRCTRCIVTAAACCFLFASRARIPRYGPGSYSRLGREKARETDGTGRRTDRRTKLRWFPSHEKRKARLPTREGTRAPSRSEAGAGR